MKWKGDAKFKGKLTCGLKNDLRNSLTFIQAVESLGNLHFDGFFLSKEYKDLDEKVKKSSAS